MKRIHEKIRKNETHSLAVEATESERPKAQVIDLMEALKNSLKLRNKHGPRAAAKGARSRKRA
jgi:non-homologous end joining protein Ku